MEFKETPNGLFIKVLDKYTNRQYWFDPEKYRNQIMPFEIMKIITQYTYHLSPKLNTLKNIGQNDIAVVYFPHCLNSQGHFTFLLSKIKQQTIFDMIVSNSYSAECQNFNNQIIGKYSVCEFPPNYWQVGVRIINENSYFDCNVRDLSYYQLYLQKIDNK